MEEKDLLEANTPKLPLQGSGSILAVERKRQNKTVEEMANELNLSVSQIRTIELDQTDGLPEPTYVRGYIRSYANLLGLDPEQVLKNYLNPNWQQSSRLDEMPRGIGSAEEHTGSRGSKLRWFVGLILVGSIGSFVWFSGYFDNIIGVTSSPDSAIVDSGTTAINATTVANQETSNDIDLSDSVATEQFDQIDSDEVAEAVIEVSSASELVLNFTQTSWVDIRDSSDTRLAYKSYVAGEELTVSSEGLMSVFIGNAEGVSVRYKGENFDISQYREGVYAKFVVNDE